MRQDWNSYFMQMALLASSRATCERLAVGAVLVKDKRVIATGYNGSVSGEKHCTDDGCLVRDGHCIRTIHAEQNALLQCARNGVSVEGSTLYVTHSPCLHCTKSLIQSGIKHIYYNQIYKQDPYASYLLSIADIDKERIDVDARS